MKKLLNILLLTLFFTHIVYPSTRGDVKIIESTEKIRFLGQKISKEYLYLYEDPNNLKIKERLLNDIELLDDAIHDIAMTTKSSDSKDILDYLVFNKNEIKNLINAPYSTDYARTMLDYSESFLEGANSIEKTHQYQFSYEEKMLMLMKDMTYLLERVSKYYVAIHLNLDVVTNELQMKKTIQKIESTLGSINYYTYPSEYAKKLEKINNAWRVHKNFLNRSKTLYVPNLLQISIVNLEKIIESISFYHKKNQ